jgi:hypothetical protein
MTKDRPCEEAIEKAREVLATGIVVGVFSAGATFGEPTDEEVEAVARLIISGVEVK